MSPGAPARCLITPSGHKDWLADAVRAGGGTITDDPGEANVLVWAAPTDPSGLRDLLDEHDNIEWVQLPWAGIEPFVDALDHDRVWTCGKGVYAEPVAEHALALTLAGMRGVGHYARRTTWSAPVGLNLLGARVTILGGGEITRVLLDLLGPFGTDVTVVRRHPEPLDGANRVVGSDALVAAVADADLVVLALALTEETEGIVDADVLAAMPEHAWLVNVARGGHVVTDDLVATLKSNGIAGAALDVTDPEPLPDDHPLWSLDNAIITPHIANTPEMGRPLLARRVTENVARWIAGDDLLGPVDVELGY